MAGVWAADAADGDAAADAVKDVLRRGASSGRAALLLRE